MRYSQFTAPQKNPVKSQWKSESCSDLNPEESIETHFRQFRLGRTCGSRGYAVLVATATPPDIQFPMIPLR